MAGSRWTTRLHVKATISLPERENGEVAEGARGGMLVLVVAVVEPAQGRLAQCGHGQRSGSGTAWAARHGGGSRGSRQKRAAMARQPARGQGVLHGMAAGGVWRGGRVVWQGGGRVVDDGVGVWTSLAAAHWREGLWGRWGPLAARDGKAGGTRCGRWVDSAQGVVEWEAWMVPCRCGEEAWNAGSRGVEQGVFVARGDGVGGGLLRQSWGRKGRLAGDGSREGIRRATTAGRGGAVVRFGFFATGVEAGGRGGLEWPIWGRGDGGWSADGGGLTRDEEDGGWSG